MTNKTMTKPKTCDTKTGDEKRAGDYGVIRACDKCVIKRAGYKGMIKDDE